MWHANVVSPWKRCGSDIVKLVCCFLYPFAFKNVHFLFVWGNSSCQEFYRCYIFALGTFGPSYNQFTVNIDCLFFNWPLLSIQI